MVAEVQKTQETDPVKPNSTPASGSSPNASEKSEPQPIEALLDQVEKKAKLDGVLADQAALVAIAKKGLLADLPETVRDEVAKEIEGKSLSQAKASVDLVRAVLEKTEPAPPKPVPGVPVPSTAGNRPPQRYEQGHAHQFIDNRNKK